MTADDETLKPAGPLTPDETGAYAFTVDAGAAGARLDKWLSDNIAALTRTRIKALIEEGALAKSGEAFTDPSWKLREGESYRLVPPPLVEPAPKPEAIPLDVVYEDDDLIVVNKPAGMVVHPAPGAWSGTLVNALLHHCGDTLSGIGGARRPGVVHRIDKDTSGLLVVAKHDAAHQGLSALFSSHDIERVYEAIAVGAPRPGIGTIDAPIGRKPQDRTKMTVVDAMVWDDDEDDYVPKHGARHAVTHYKVIEAFGRDRAKLRGDALASLIECTLETGRTHQIRVHLGSIGCPLIGDQSYGRGPGLSGLKPGVPAADEAIETIRSFKRQALHAKVLGFTHPMTGEAMRFEREAPDDFQALLKALRAL